MTTVSYLPEAFREACHQLSDRLGGPMGANKTPHDWERFFKMERTSEITAMGAGKAVVVYEDSTKQTVLASNAIPQAAVQAATTAVLPAVTMLAGVLTAAANGVLAAIDGVTLAAGQAVLVKNQAAPANNGVYTVTSIGAAGAPFILTRRADFNAAIASKNAVVVAAGTVNANKAFKLTTVAPIVVNTTALTFAELADDGATALFGLLATLLPDLDLALAEAA